ncbi:hypothetical protein OHJ21_25420 [Virgibacillus sp. LDC1]|nr:hypothetical protein [Virgibacillus sp. LDC1]
MKKNEDINRRFITYMANLIYYNSINYANKRRMKDNRFPLMLDNNENQESALFTVYDSESIPPPNLKDRITVHLQKVSIQLLLLLIDSSGPPADPLIYAALPRHQIGRTQTKPINPEKTDLTPHACHLSSHHEII